MVKCSLINCTHNENCKCTADEIEITDKERETLPGKYEEFQECKTFEWRGGK